LGEGDCIRLRTPGGGGYGSPLDRDPAKVFQDVTDELITRDEATTVYGVSFKPSSTTVDEQATARQREHMRNAAS